MRASESRPLVAVSSDVRAFDNNIWHAAPLSYIEAAVSGAGVTPVLVPNFGERLDIDRILDAVDGVLLTGSKSNVHPSLYGEEASEANGPYDRARDETALPLLGRALARGIPLLAICRGMQELNVAAGGTLDCEIQEQPGRLDHRAPVSEAADERFALRQALTVKPGSLLADIIGDVEVVVNSLHRQAIGRPGPNIVIEATAEDGIIKAVSVEGARSFAIGVQWHPEYWVASDAASARIFRAFGDAVRTHEAARRSPEG